VIVLILGGVLIGLATVLDWDFRLRMKRAGYKWALLRGGTFNYSEYDKVRAEHGWPAWPVYVMWFGYICGITLLIAGAFIYLGHSPGN
jgi:hypothetical protein